MVRPYRVCIISRWWARQQCRKRPVGLVWKACRSILINLRYFWLERGLRSERSSSFLFNRKQWWMGRSCYTSAGAYVLEQRWQFRQQLEQDQQLGVVHRAAVFPSQAEKTGYMSDPRSSRQIKLLTRVRVLNKRVATCPIRKVARVKEFLF